MIHIVADSTVYRNDPRREKAAFKALARLAQGKHVTLHIPEIVRREFLSQEEEFLQKNAKAIEDALHNLTKRPMDPKGAEHLKKVADASADLAKKLEPSTAKEFDAWAKSILAKDHPIAPAHGSQVMDAYFAGAPPFKQKKNRNDIPDGFVWQAIQDLAKAHKPLYVVSGDAGIRAPLQDNPDFVVFASLEDLIASAPIQALLKKHYASANFSALLALLPGQIGFLEKEIEGSLVDELAGKMVSDGEEDDSEPTITGVDSPEDLEVDPGEAVDHGGGLAVVPFKLKVECGIEFCIDKSAYYTMDEDEAERISISPLNDHRFSAEENRTVVVEGWLSVQVDPAKLHSEKMDEASLLKVLKDGDISVDSIEEMAFVPKA